jgi:hypothetical protein
MRIERYSDSYKILETLKYSTPKTATLIARQRFAKAVLKTSEYEQVSAQLEILSDVGLVEIFRVMLTEHKSERVVRITDFGLQTLKESTNG